MIYSRFWISPSPWASASVSSVEVRASEGIPSWHKDWRGQEVCGWGAGSTELREGPVSHSRTPDLRIPRPVLCLLCNKTVRQKSFWKSVFYVFVCVCVLEVSQLVLPERILLFTFFF